MKSIKILLLFSVLLSSITNCASQKIEQTAPVNISSMYKQHWNSGQKAGGSGTNIFINLESELPKHITLDTIYYDTFQLPLKQDTRNSLTYVGRLVKKSKTDYTSLKPDKTLDADIKSTNTSSKFQLENNECIVRYTSSGTVKFFKYDSLYTKQTPLIPQSRPKQ